MDSDPGSITHFFGQLRGGDPAAAEAIWARFFPRLVGLARKTLTGKPQRVADADDAAQSAFASFCLRVKAGEFEVANRSELWHLLAAVTANKARMQVRREAAAKRGGNRVADGGASLEDITGQVPAAEFDLQCEDLLNRLEPELREFAMLRLLGYRNAEIAKMHDCTERKIERKLNLIRALWKSEYPGAAQD